MAADPAVPTLVWQPTGTSVVLDTAPPALLEACLEAGKLCLELSETPDLAAASAAILLDGSAIAWTLRADGYTLESTAPIAAGTHTLTFTAGTLDLAGNALAALPPIDFDATDTHLWSAPRPGELGIQPGEYAVRSAVGNPFGFKGLPVDPETGFYYVRHRYYDPELGRFLTPDPLGYVDGGNLYQFALNNPINRSDPLGLSPKLFGGYEHAIAEAEAVEAMDAVELRQWAEDKKYEGRQGLSMAVGMVPVIGTGTSLRIAYTGYDPILDQELSSGERALMVGIAVLSLIPADYARGRVSQIPPDEAFWGVR